MFSPVRAQDALTDSKDRVWSNDAPYSVSGAAVVEIHFLQ
jgi:hypothetical protein